MPGGLCYFIQQGFAGSKDDVSLLSQVPSLPPHRANQCEHDLLTQESKSETQSPGTL